MSLRLRGINPFPNGKKVSNRPQILDQSANCVDASNSNERTARVGNQQSSNKSTTKEHCQMRIRTMSIPQLQQRIRIIERARGQHCVAKLSIMYECCIDANLHELAQEANDAIQRLTKARKWKRKNSGSRRELNYSIEKLIAYVDPYSAYVEWAEYKSVFILSMFVVCCCHLQ